MKTVVHEKTTYQIGQSAEENWALIARATKDHWWVHLEGRASAHIILEIDDPLDDELVFAAGLCKVQTKIERTGLPCVATRVGNLRLGSKAGEVYFKKDGAAHVRHFVV